MTDGFLFQAKGAVIHAVQKELKRPTAKGDVVWSVRKEGDLFVGSVSIPHRGLLIEGEPCYNRKEAEASAGLVALPQLSGAGGTGTSHTPSSKSASKGKAKGPRWVAPSHGTEKTANLSDGDLEQPPTKKAKLNTTPVTQVEKDSCLSEYHKWRDERLESGADPTCENAQSLCCWYAQICLVCLTPVSGTANWQMHVGGHKHMNKYKALGGVRLRPGVPRPEIFIPQLSDIPKQLSMFHQRALGEEALASFNGAEMQSFIDATGYANCKWVLSLGEQDYSFSLQIAKLQTQAGHPVKLVASSYLGKHDSLEKEVHVADDGARFEYSRKSLPAMNGDLFKNLAAIEALGGINLHSVDATDLPGTLLTQLTVGEFDIVVFPFPRFSLKRSVDPGNSLLLRGFFRSVNQAGVLAPGGVCQLLLLGTQYAEWDTACMAQEAGFELVAFAPLPPGFYQSREMTGKRWTPLNGVLYSFRLKDSVPHKQ